MSSHYNLIDAFYHYWRGQMGERRAPGFTRQESVAIETFARWLTEHYAVAPKERS